MQPATLNPVAQTHIAPNTLADDSDEKCCTCRNATGPVFKVLNALGAAATAAAAIVTLIFRGDSIAPAIATVVAAVATAFFACLNEGWDIYINYDDGKKAKIKEKEKEKTEETRYQNLSDLLMKTLETVQNYQNNPNSEGFAKCMDTIKEIPDGAETHTMNRGILLSKVIEATPDEMDDNGLKKTFRSIDQLFTKIDNQKQVIDAGIQNDNIIKQNSGNNGESAAIETGNSNDLSFAINLERFQKEWKNIEDLVGFKLNVRKIDGVLYDRNANKVGETLVATNREEI